MKNRIKIVLAHLVAFFAVPSTLISSILLIPVYGIWYGIRTAWNIFEDL